MKAIKIPFSFSKGGVTETTDITKITEQKIVDVLITTAGERAINTGYGMGIQSLIYEPIDSLAFDDYKDEAITAINDTLDSGRVVDILIASPDSPQMAFPEDSTLSITVRYILPPYGGRAFTFDLTSDI